MVGGIRAASEGVGNSMIVLMPPACATWRNGTSVVHTEVPPRYCPCTDARYCVPDVASSGSANSVNIGPVPTAWPLTARSSNLERLGRWYADQTVGGVVLSGPAGVGKTRLGEEALRAAAAADRPTARAVGHPA